MTIEGVEFVYTQEVARGRRLVLVLTAPHRVTVRVPAGLEADLPATLKRHRRWLISHHHRLMTKCSSRPDFTPGGWIWDGGERRSIADLGVVGVFPSAVKTEIAAWYRHQARLRFPERVSYWSRQLHIPYKDLVISESRSRWGYCRPDGRIALSWRLCQAPGWVVDYVIVHELVHRLHPHHQSAFWQRVRQAYPASDEARQWLTAMGPALMWE